MKGIEFDYFRGMEADQYTFYRIPKILFTAECFKSLSCEAKVLYGLLLDRMSLSFKNRWFDEENRVYIVFTVEDIAELMGCGIQKAVKLLKELDVDKGIGLIEKKRMGLGKPNVIYVKNFMVRNTTDDEAEEKQFENAAPAQNCENHNSRMMKITNQEFPALQFRNSENHNSAMVKAENDGITTSQYQNDEGYNSEMMKNTFQESPEPQFKNSENHNSGIMKTTIQELSKSQFKNYQNHNSGIVKITTHEFPKSQSNYTDINKTDDNNTEQSNQSYLFTGGNTIDVMGEMDAYRKIIREKISYQHFINKTEGPRAEVDELVELMVEVMLMPDSATLRVAGADKPVAMVKNRFMKLSWEHIEYVVNCMEKNTRKVGNIKAYLLTALYNSALTIDNYYRAEVNYGMYGGG